METIAYLSVKISEHRDQFFAAFPEETLTPKHHFLEHYPAMIESYGPLGGIWTMKFEAKHSFLKQVVRHNFQKRVIDPYYKTSADDGIPLSYRCRKTLIVCHKNI